MARDGSSLTMAAQRPATRASKADPEALGASWVCGRSELSGRGGAATASADAGGAAGRGAAGRVVRLGGDALAATASGVELQGGAATEGSPLGAGGSPGLQASRKISGAQAIERTADLPPLAVRPSAATLPSLTIEAALDEAT